MSQSPLQATPTRAYEDGLRAINRLIRENGSWSGHERNIFLHNNGSGFADVSGTVGLDLDQDGRAFAVADYDRDGDPDIVVKSRTGPQVRLLRNDARNRNTSVSFRLLGVESNRDAIGAAVTVETAESKQIKMVLGGSGFLSQHSKELLFGLGEAEEIVRVAVQWPSGLRQAFDSVPVGHRVVLEEKNPELRARPFRKQDLRDSAPSREAPDPPDPPYTGTWLLEPYAAPDFALTDLEGNEHRLSQYRGRPVLINFWATWCPPCRAELSSFQGGLSELESLGTSLLAVAVNEPADLATVKSFVRDRGLGLTVLPADEEMVRAYNTLNKYLFDKNQDLQIPTTFLLNGSGSVVKVYRGVVDVGQIVVDLRRMPANREERFKAAVPFPGRFYGNPPGRNYFRLGTAFSENDLVEPALAAFQKATEASPNSGKAFYNLGLLYLKKKDAASARTAFEQALERQPDHPEVHNNLGALLADAGKIDEAVRHFMAALASRPNDADTLNNLGNAYMQSSRGREAREMFEKALAIHPTYPEALNNLGIIFGEQGDLEQARSYFHKALEQRPDYPEAANNLARVYAATGHGSQAVGILEESLRRNAGFEATYLTLAQVYVGAR